MPAVEVVSYVLQSFVISIELSSRKNKSSFISVNFSIAMGPRKMAIKKFMIRNKTAFKFRPQLAELRYVFDVQFKFENSCLILSGSHDDVMEVIGRYDAWLYNYKLNSKS